MAEFDWWLLVLGLVVGGGLVYLVLAESARRDEDLEVEELDAEASFISERLGDVGLDLSQPEVAEVLREHRAYLRLPPPDTIVSAPGEALDEAAVDAASSARGADEPGGPPDPPELPEPLEPPAAQVPESPEPRPTREART
ncbi:MAG: hypothetical protein L0221_04265 [Chloroflexi bacterium]|nr:hypothetical protein [Chloroflexota bacterium]